MSSEITAKVSAEKQLEIPAEIRDKLQPGDEYIVSMTEEAIVLRKVQSQAVNLDEFFQHLDEAEIDPNQPTLQEISEMVKEVRRERRAQS